MCIYIISDDLFFVKGLQYFLSANDMRNKRYNHTNWESIFYFNKPHKDDVFVIDVSLKNCNSRLCIENSTHYFGANIVFIVDLPLQNKYNELPLYWLISKKSSFKTFIPLLRKNRNNKFLIENQLSRKEKTIIHELCTGKSTILISKKFNISIKTISSHKHNAIKKLGMEKLNDISLVCYKELMNLYFFFNTEHKINAQRSTPATVMYRKFPQYCI